MPLGVSEGASDRVVELDEDPVVNLTGVSESSKEGAPTVLARPPVREEERVARAEDADTRGEMMGVPVRCLVGTSGMLVVISKPRRAAMCRTREPAPQGLPRD